MNIIKTSAVAFIAMASALLTQAQTAPASAPTGVLGTRYTELSFGTHDIKGISRNFNDLTLQGNKPINANLDGGFGYSYGWIGGAFKGHTNTLQATATAYAPLSNIKPFVGAGVGYEWAHFNGNSDRYGIWGLAVGLEFPMGPLSFTPAIVYSDDMQRSANSSQQFSYGVDANYWLDGRSAISAGVSYADEKGGNGEAWSYNVGYRWKF